MDAEVLASIRELISQGCRSSQSLDRKGGIHVLEVMGRRGDAHMGSHTCIEVRRIHSLLRPPLSKSTSESKSTSN